MNTLRIQGIVFSVAAMLIAATAAAIERFDEQTELIVLAVPIILLGVPHGALDPVFAFKLYNIRTAAGWTGFALAYLILAAIVVGLWQSAPILFLAGFLMLSVAHFSGDPVAGTPVCSRILYGGAIIILPTLLHASEVARLFSSLVGTESAALIVPWLRLLGWPWLIGIAFGVAHLAGADWLTGLEMASLGLLAILAPPLLAFALFFCGMHGARHILRAIDYSGGSSALFLLVASMVPMLAVLFMFAAGWHWLGDVPLNARVIQLIFVGLAALTVPHMAIVERVRLSGWTKRAVHLTG